MKKNYIPIRRHMQTFAYLCLLFLSISVKNAFANDVKKLAEFTVIGVVSEENGSLLPGVAIQLKGTNKGAVTDSKGRYSINAEKKDAILVFSMLGFTAQTVPVNGKSIINVTLKPDVKTLEEVVFIGYGTAQKKDVTGAITTLKMEDVKGMNFAGIDQAMQGKVAGVNVTNNTGQPGGGVSVRIRGLTSLTGSNEPLYVIDGVPFNGDGDNTVDASQFGGGGGQTNSSVLSSLNPSDILTLDILKDASATAIYGSRASNGVIIITTKRGKVNESKITYDGSIGTQMTPKKLEVMNLAEYAAYTNTINTSVGRKPNEEFARPEILGTGTNWQDEIFRLAKVTNHQLSFSGGKDGSTFYVSGGYFKQEGIVVGSEFERLSLRVNLDNQVKSWLKIGSSLTASKTSQRITLNDDEGGVIASAFLQNPSIAVKNPNGSWGGATESNGGNQVNPVALALLIDNNKYNTRFNGNLFADVTFLKYFSFRNEFGGDLGFGNNVAFKPTYNWGINYNFQNKLITQNSQSTYWNLKNILTYTRGIGKSWMQVMAGHEAQSSKWEGTSASRSDFKTNDIYSLDAGDLKTATNGQYIGNNAMESYFARANFAFDSKYNLTLTGRSDGSSNFGPANRRGFFPSAAFAWTLSNESFMKSLPVISNLKLRLGWGIVGNANINSYAFGAALNSFPSQFGTTFVPDKIPNKTVKWESSKQINVGIDFGIYKDRLSTSIDVYDKTSSNFLYQLPLPMILGTQPWGGIAPPFVNLGEMNNKGIDLAVNATILQQKDFNWNTNIIYSKYRNKLVSLVDESTAILRNVQWFNTVTKTSVGQPLGMFYGYRVEGIFKSEEELKTAPKQQKVDVNSTWVGDLKFKDLNADGVIDGLDREIIGTPHPKFTMGMTNSFTYKGFDLSVFMNSSYGNNIFNYSRRETEGLSNPFSNQLKTVNDRWTPENPEGKLPRFQWGDGNDNRRISDRYIEDGSFVRVQNLSLGYKLPDVIARKLKMSKGRVYVSGQNLKTFTKYTGLDPEIGSYNQDALLSNIDSGHYPVPRSYTMGINLEF